MFEARPYQDYASQMMEATPLAEPGVAAALRQMAMGGRMACPYCGKTWMRSGYHYHRLFAPVRDHIQSVHPEKGAMFNNTIKWVCHEVEAARDAAQKAEEKEARDRVTRKIVVTGGFLDEIADEIRSLIGMMEPYYVGCERDACLLLDRIEALAAGGATKDGRLHAEDFANKMMEKYPTVMDHLSEI
ncbi:hypothetical protein HOU03_gp054 [Caulobacter phage CcrSC]|uniref:Uncharacterized protein n=1 Tax=Caulobacter phage CcrSC TaxID=2283272 RepID=A0A385ED75_9CAUD|nr:hypothetical protein HOU03_gp054 [Caulobacter phage CcrSC]AXQ69636.1 hypothetical protein CcrSC_gp054c [Caulobacter phage CcrSC]